MDEDQGITYDMLSTGYNTRFTFVGFGLGLRASKKFIYNDEFGLLKQAMQLLRYSAEITKNIKAWQMWNLAYTSGVNGGDGEPLAYNAHPLSRGGTFANDIGAVALSPTAVETAMIQADTLVGDNNLPANVMMKYCIVPVQLRKTATEIFGTGPKAAYTTDNTINIDMDRLVPFVSRFANVSTIQWSVFAEKPGDDAEKNPQARMNPNTHHLRVIDEWDYNFETAQDFETKGLKTSVDCSFAVGFEDWRGTIFSSGA